MKEDRRGSWQQRSKNEYRDRLCQNFSGVRYAKTIGSPITMYISNRDFKNWLHTMPTGSVDLDGTTLLKPRPGHADLAGLMKYGVSDFRGGDILERASAARETATRVAAGAVCKLLLKAFGISIMSYTVQIGNILANMSSIKEGDVRFNTEVSYVRYPGCKC